jgi:hypothetical protein
MRLPKLKESYTGSSGFWRFSAMCFIWVCLSWLKCSCCLPFHLCFVLYFNIWLTLLMCLIGLWTHPSGPVAIPLHSATWLLWGWWWNQGSKENAKVSPFGPINDVMTNYSLKESLLFTWNFFSNFSQIFKKCGILISFIPHFYF